MITEISKRLRRWKKSEYDYSDEYMITTIKKGDPLTEKIIACCFKVHSELGPGFPEKIYHNALKMVLKQQELKYESEKEYEVHFQGKKIGKFRLDLVIENKAIVELKAISGNFPIVFEYQLLSYLKASGVKTGLLINFGNKSCYIRRLMI